MIFQIIRRYLLGVPVDIMAKLAWRKLKRIVQGRFHPKPVYQSLGDVSEFDRFYGVKTSAGAPWERLRTGSRTDPYATCYLPSPPSVVRYALARLPSELEEFTFVDIGCGLGRAMIIASEFPFKAITGIEKTPYLCEVARFNSLIIRNKYRDRAPITIIESDIVDVELPEGNLVIYMYDPFMKPVMKLLVRLIERSLLVSDRTIFIIYVSPRWRYVFDRSPAFEPDNERSFLAPTNDEYPKHTEVAIWRSRPLTRLTR
jgi:SAM-dependent methyltransferase